MTIQNTKLTIRGEVQGVGFRAAAYGTARRLHVSGFVMNEPDGGVYLEAEGEMKNLEALLAWCRKGPVTGKVDEVIVAWGEPHGKFTGFRIA